MISTSSISGGRIWRILHVLLGPFTHTIKSSSRNHMLWCAVCVRVSRMGMT